MLGTVAGGGSVQPGASWKDQHNPVVYTSG